MKGKGRLPLVRDEDQCSSIRNCDHERFIRTVGVEAIEGLEYVTVSRSGLTVVWKGLVGRSDGHTYELKVDNEDTFKWYRDGRRHREDGPAIVKSDGTQEWYRDGRRHREDGPAVVWQNGTQQWFRDGRLHRECGPAVVCLDGYQAWYRDGVLHREDGPAIIQPDGTEERWLNGVRQILPLFDVGTRDVRAAIDLHACGKALGVPF